MARDRKVCLRKRTSSRICSDGVELPVWPCESGDARGTGCSRPISRTVELVLGKIASRPKTEDGSLDCFDHDNGICQAKIGSRTEEPPANPPRQDSITGLDECQASAQDASMNVTLEAFESGETTRG